MSETKTDRDNRNPMMHGSDLAHLQRIVVQLTAISNAHGDPSNLAALAADAQTAHKAYSDVHARDCLGCLPVPLERRKWPRATSLARSGRQITDALSGHVDEGQQP